MRAAAVLTLLTFAAPACQKPPAIETSGAPSGFEGTWKWVCCGGRMTGVLSLAQKDDAVIGAMSTGTGGAPQIAVHGKVEGTILRFEREADGGTQRFTLRVDATGEAMRGAFDGPHDPTMPTDLVARRISRSQAPR